MDSYDEAEKVAPFQWRRVTTDGDIGLRIEYFGAEASCLITVTADGDLQSAIGDLGSEVADTTFLEPGGTPGTIDVSDALANTFGLLVNVINAIPYYRAHLVDVLAADSSDDTLNAASAAQAKVEGGLALVKDTSVALNLSLAISGEDFQYEESGSKNELQGYVVKPTGTGADTVKLYEGTTLVYQVAGPGTGVEASKNADEFQHGAKGKKLLLRLDMATTMTAGELATMARTVRLVPLRKRPV